MSTNNNLSKRLKTQFQIRIQMAIYKTRKCLFLFKSNSQLKGKCSHFTLLVILVGSGLPPHYQTSSVIAPFYLLPFIVIHVYSFWLLSKKPWVIFISSAYHCLFKIIFLCYRSESTVIQRISGDIKRELYGKFSTFTKELVGLVEMESCAEEMTELLGVCCSTSSIVFSVTPLWSF